MAGTYIEGTSQVLSGVYTLIQAAVEAVTAGDRGVVTYPFTSNWGPVNALTLATSASEYKDLFNAAATDLTAAKIYKHAFKGSPQEILCYRMATGSAAKGILTLNDNTAVKSLELETLYPSNRAFAAVVKDSLTVGNKILEIVEGSIKLLSIDASSMADLITQINNSDYIRVKTSGANFPATNAGATFTDGNNGEAVTATEYAAYLDVLEADRQANAFSLDGVVDSAILTTTRTWVKRVRAEGFYITFVQGGPLSWDASIATANTASTLANHRAIINVGNGLEGDSSADLAIFIAARAASVALNRSLADEKVDYTTVNKKLRPGERIVAKKSGTLVFVQDGNAILIDEGVNTLTGPGADEVVDMGKIRVNNTLDQIAKDLEAFGVEYKKTRSNTDEARMTYASTVEDTYFKPLATKEVIQGNYSYEPDPAYHGDKAVNKPKIDEAFFLSAIWPVDSMERIYQKIGVHF